MNETGGGGGGGGGGGFIHMPKMFLLIFLSAKNF